MIHLAFGHDFGDPGALARAVAEESAALAVLGEELLGSDRPLVTVSGTPYVPGRASTEADPLPTDGPVGGRGRTVAAVLDLASRGVRSSAVRMPRTVHNDGRGGFAGLLTHPQEARACRRLPLIPLDITIPGADTRHLRDRTPTRHGLMPTSMTAPTSSADVAPPGPLAFTQERTAATVAGGRWPLASGSVAMPAA